MNSRRKGISVRPLISVISIAGLLLSATVAPGFQIELLGVPVRANPATEITIQLQYQRDPGDEEKRIVYIVRMRRAATDTLLRETIADNNGLGYTDDQGTIDFPFRTPASEGDNVYFTATAAPWSMNRAVLDTIATYPTGNTYPYSIESQYGVTRDLRYQGGVIASADAQRHTHDRGITFEAFIVTWNEYNDTYNHSSIAGIGLGQMLGLRRQWYGESEYEKLPVYAIVQNDIGIEISDREDIQPGDFIYFWRVINTRQAGIFISWERNSSNRITGVNYWSSTSATQGIGTSLDYFEGYAAFGINEDRFYAARMQKPRDLADQQWALDALTTTPTLIQTAPPQGWMMY